MTYIIRSIEALIAKSLRRGKSVLLLGPRQTGKSTLLSRLSGDLAISMARPDVRQPYERDPGRLAAEVEAISQPNGSPLLVLLDEVQRVPALLDVAQDLIDRKVAVFVFTGSSARKLRRSSSVNLLPGRVVTLRLDPLSFGERVPASLQEALYYGSLPGIVTEPDAADRETDLQSYSVTYLEEEIRAEALVRNVGAFGRFLELAAAESGSSANFLNLSQDVGVSRTAVVSFYEILEDCLIAERVDPLPGKSTRKRLAKSSKYLFFDLGVRRACAREGVDQPRDAEGKLFEQMVGLELLHLSRLSPAGCTLHFWKDLNGPEVDWVVRKGDTLIPVEAKMTATPSSSDVRHLRTFLEEYPAAPHAFLVCDIPRRQQLADRITAVPWRELPNVLD